MKHYIFLICFLSTLLCNEALIAQRVGIGITAPSQMLDVNGFMQIRHNGAQTAGIYFNSTNLTNRSFVGMMNADYIGFWGAGTNWNFVMNTKNGNIGVGNTSPTTRLDVNGTLRIRDNAKAGAVMTAQNTAGNMGWVGPVSFMTMGTPAGGNFTVNTSGFTYSRVPFAQPDVNHGNAWDAVNHVFIAPYTGIYHFAAHIELLGSKQNLKIQLTKWNGSQNIVLYYGESFITAEGKLIDGHRPYEIALDTRLQQNDVVFLEVTNVISEPKCTLNGARPKHYFSGQLVALQ